MKCIECRDAYPWYVFFAISDIIYVYQVYLNCVVGFWTSKDADPTNPKVITPRSESLATRTLQPGLRW